MLRALCARLAVSLVVFVSLCGVARAQGAAAPGERASVVFTALDREKKSVTTLRPEDLRLTVDGSPREILELRRQAQLPLFLAVVIDRSASQEAVLPSAKLAAQVFVRGVMAPGFDHAALVTFANDATLELPMTDDVTEVREAIGRVRLATPPGYVGGGVVIGGPGGGIRTMPAGSTSVWDAVYLAADEVLPRSLGRGRRAVLLITDGVDTSSRMKLDEAAASALRSEAVVYAVGVGDDKAYEGVDKGALRKLAERTGGRAFFPKKLEELTAIFTQVSQELFSQYVVTFAADGLKAGSAHKLRLEVAGPALRSQGLDLAYPRAFYAGAAPAPAVRKK